MICPIQKVLGSLQTTCALILEDWWVTRWVEFMNALSWNNWMYACTWSMLNVVVVRERMIKFSLWNMIWTFVMKNSNWFFHYSPCCTSQCDGTGVQNVSKQSLEIFKEWRSCAWSHLLLEWGYIWIPHQAPCASVCAPPRECSTISRIWAPCCSCECWVILWFSKSTYQPISSCFSENVYIFDIVGYVP